MKALHRLHHSSSTHWVGNGFPVRSVFDYDGLGRELSPFLLLDYAPPQEFPSGAGGKGERRGVEAHPHKGFETVTVVYQGELEHRDSSGGGGTIGVGDVQWMTAGRGIVHEEFHSEAFTSQGGLLQMAQLWVNLPARDKSAPPRYQTLRREDMTELPLPGGAGLVRVIAGSFEARQGPAKTFTPIDLWDVTLRARKTATLPLTDGHTAAFLLIEGTVLIQELRTANEGDLAIFEREGHHVTLRAETECRLLLMAGEPIDEPIVGYGPFVMNTRQEIEQAFQDYQLGRMGDLPD